MPKSIDSTKMLIEHLYAEEFPETFSDKNLKDSQCKGFKSRSFSDLYSIINTRFPSVTPQIFAYHLINKLKNSSSFGRQLDFKFLFCTEINKIIFKSKKHLFFYSLKDTEDLIDIKSDKNLIFIVFFSLKNTFIDKFTSELTLEKYLRSKKLNNIK